ncbi:MAG TPA: hypothetical protein VGL82_13640 [Bryobacteraceae bacterium]|jgi:hypothetical protein
MTSKTACRFLCATFALSVPAFAASGTTCDRACLRHALDQYMNAVLKHDPTAAPLFPGFRQTENAVVVKLGDGTWKSVTALGKVQRHFLDPVSEQAAYFGTVEESNESAIVTVRVKVIERKISEAEWFLARRAIRDLTGRRHQAGRREIFSIRRIWPRILRRTSRLPKKRARRVKL